MTKKSKTQKTQICFFVQNRKKQKYLRFATFEAITFDPIEI